MAEARQTHVSVGLLHLEFLGKMYPVPLCALAPSRKSTPNSRNKLLRLMQKQSGSEIHMRNAKHIDIDNRLVPKNQAISNETTSKHLRASHLAAKKRERAHVETPTKSTEPEPREAWRPKKNGRTTQLTFSCSGSHIYIYIYIDAFGAHLFPAFRPGCETSPLLNLSKQLRSLTAQPSHLSYLTSRLPSLPAPTLPKSPPSKTPRCTARAAAKTTNSNENHQQPATLEYINGSTKQRPGRQMSIVEKGSSWGCHQPARC